MAAGAVSLSLLALSACQKPSPNAHFTLGSSTETRETEEDCFGHGEPLGTEQSQACLESDQDTPVFTTRSGDTLRMGVDAEVAEAGWLLFFDGSLSEIAPRTVTYGSFETDELYGAIQQQGQAPPEDLKLSIAQVTESYDEDKLLAVYQSQGPEAFQAELYGSLEGVWNVQLETESAGSEDSQGSGDAGEEEGADGGQGSGDAGPQD